MEVIERARYLAQLRESSLSKSPIRQLVPARDNRHSCANTLQFCQSLLSRSLLSLTHSLISCPAFDRFDRISDWRLPYTLKACGIRDSSLEQVLAYKYAPRSRCEINTSMSTRKIRRVSSCARRRFFCSQTSKVASTALD